MPNGRTSEFDTGLNLSQAYGGMRRSLSDTDLSHASTAQLRMTFLLHFSIAAFICCTVTRRIGNVDARRVKVAACISIMSMMFSATFGDTPASEAKRCRWLRSTALPSPQTSI